jgi:hypothetical protein
MLLTGSKLYPIVVILPTLMLGSHTQCVIHWELQNQDCLQLVLSITMQMEIATSKTLLMLYLVVDIRSRASHSDMMEQCRY